MTAFSKSSRLPHGALVATLEGVDQEQAIVMDQLLELSAAGFVATFGEVRVLTELQSGPIGTHVNHALALMLDLTDKSAQPGGNV
jgi:hypothetical protein